MAKTSGRIFLPKIEGIFTFYFILSLSPTNSKTTDYYAWCASVYPHLARHKHSFEFISLLFDFFLFNTQLIRELCVWAFSQQQRLYSLRKSCQVLRLKYEHSFSFDRMPVVIFRFYANWLDFKQKTSHQFNWTWQNGEKIVLLCNWAAPVVRVCVCREISTHRSIQ